MIARSADGPPVAVLGAGIAGLAVARELHRAGVPVRVFEAGDRIAGLARSHADADGFSYDFGAHFVTNRLADALGVPCRDVPRYGESVLRRGKVSAYPLGLLANPRYVGGAVLSRLAGGRCVTAADWFRKQYGRPLADEVALPLLEAWSGLPAHELSAAVGESLPGSILQTIRLTVARRTTGKAIAIGYSRELPHGTGVWHVYPTGGLGALCEKLAAGLDDCVQLRSPVERVVVRDGRVAAVRCRGEEIAVAGAVSTAPVHALASLGEGTDALRPLARFRYRPMLFVNLRLAGRPALRDVVVWTPESRYPFFRLTDVSQSMPWTAPDGHSLVTVDVGCQVGDRHWAMADDDLGAYCVDHIGGIIPDVRERYRGCRVLRTPVAYPVFALEYEEDRRRFEAGTGVPGLWSVGRNGEFAHLFMEDVYVRAVRKAGEVIAYWRELAGRPVGEPVAVGT